MARITDFLGEKGHILCEKETIETNVLGEKISDVHIEKIGDVIRSIKVFYSDVLVYRRTRKHKDRVYTWVERRVILPSNMPDTELVYILTEKDFEKLVGILRRCLYRK